MEERESLRQRVARTTGYKHAKKKKKRRRRRKEIRQRESLHPSQKVNSNGCLTKCEIQNSKEKTYEKIQMTSVTERNF